MNPSHALYYPTSYYKTLGQSCAQFMAMIFTPEVSPFSATYRLEWQEDLENFNSGILLASRLDESVAIGAMLLLLRLSKLERLRPDFPDPWYCEIFFAACWTAEQQLAPLSPHGDEFWLDVLNVNIDGPAMTVEKAKRSLTTFIDILDGEVAISDEEYRSVRNIVYTLVYMRTGQLVGASKEDEENLFKRTPCWREMSIRKKEMETPVSPTDSTRKISIRTRIARLCRCKRKLDGECRFDRINTEDPVVTGSRCPNRLRLY